MSLMDSIAPSHLTLPVSGPVSTEDLGEILARLRTAQPLVQCLTNAVVTNFTANVLLALGAAPAMVDVPVEAGEFARIASGVLVNLGTPHGEQRAGMIEAARTAKDLGTPWVLDPVAVGALTVRTAFAELVTELRPAVVRGNASEVIALAGTGTGGRGVDATDDVESARGAALALAARTGGTVAVSGPVDLVLDAGRSVRVHGGSALLTKVTGGGCSLGAVTAAFAAAAGDPFAGAVAAHAMYAVASEAAAERSSGPGTFAPAFLDALASTTPEDLAAKAVLR
jgi:hydroxyethylthiazole kinase